jgi:hypothetical protein
MPLTCDNPHLAGRRGWGDTYALNAGKAMYRDRKLVPSQLFLRTYVLGYCQSLLRSKSAEAFSLNPRAWAKHLMRYQPWFPDSLG